MPLRIYNTKSRSKEIFQPLQAGKVGIYVCGPTVYDYCHLGHARAYVVFDTVVRHFKNVGYQVTYVRNLTDIDDKIIHRAQKEGSDWQSVAQKFTEAFHQDLAALQTLPPDVEPRATAHLDQMQRIIEKLIVNGSAYAVNGDVYFSVNSYAQYGSLSGRNTEELLAGARVEVNETKRNPLDFALWKSSKPGEPNWPSPWGPGRPGWHIECSAMSEAYLGQSFDIHGGGKDLVFPHHENEQAQSEAANHKPFVRYWLHNGFVTLDKEKMSKSLGNLVTIRALLDQFGPEVLRYFLLTSHYRSPIEFSTDQLIESRAALTRIYNFLSTCDAPAVTGKFTEEYLEVMNDDFNTPKALAIVFEAAKEGNRLLAEGRLPDARVLAGQIRWIGAALGGIINSKPTDFLQQQPSMGRATERVAIDAAWVESMIQKRLQARQDKNFAEADRLRAELLDKGVILEDGPKGTTWKTK